MALQNTDEKTPQFEQMLGVATETALIHTWTALPGIVKSFNSTDQTADVRAALLQEYTQEDGTIASREHPVLLNVPVHFTRGGGYAITHPLEAGDSGLIVFSARCIDTWAQSGGVQPQAIRRKHSFSDGIFIPGISAVADALASLETSGLELRNDAGDTKITIKDGLVEITGTGLRHNDINVGFEHVHPVTGSITGPPTDPP